MSGNPQDPMFSQFINSTGINDSSTTLSNLGGMLSQLGGMVPGAGLLRNSDTPSIPRKLQGMLTDQNGVPLNGKDPYDDASYPAVSNPQATPDNPQGAPVYQTQMHIPGDRPGKMTPAMMIKGKPYYYQTTNDYLDREDPTRNGGAMDAPSREPLSNVPYQINPMGNQQQMQMGQAPQGGALQGYAQNTQGYTTVDNGMGYSQQMPQGNGQPQVGTPDYALKDQGAAENFKTFPTTQIFGQPYAAGQLRDPATGASLYVNPQTGREVNPPAHIAQNPPPGMQTQAPQQIDTNALNNAIMTQKAMFPTTGKAINPTAAPQQISANALNNAIMTQKAMFPTAAPQQPVQQQINPKVKQALAQMGGDNLKDYANHIHTNLNINPDVTDLLTLHTLGKGPGTELLKSTMKNPAAPISDIVAKQLTKMGHLKSGSPTPTNWQLYNLIKQGTQ